MTALHKSLVFLALTFALSWGVTIGFGYTEIARDPSDSIVVLFAMMAGPAIAALVCAFAFEKGRRVQALGLAFKPNWWWLSAWLIPLAIAAASVAATLLLSDRSYVDIADSIAAAAAVNAPEQAELMRQMPNATLIVVAGAATIGALVNAPILALTEELGWRGYLHFLWRPFGFWRASLGTGFVWGVWHAPAIYLYGLNYPDHRVLGVGVFVVFCMLLSPLMTLVRDRAGSVWAAGIFHGTINALGSLTLAAVSDPTFPWNGIVGVGGLVALALGVLGVLALRPGAGPRSCPAAAPAVSTPDPPKDRF